ncbi:MAG: SMP-30/gluconolactonase/LRE family protein [Flavobacteriia bacterium]|nr:MAG: SMP-30/gluconolactonase/LRE family protein [Flavobacteriia bacterium]
MKFFKYILLSILIMNLISCKTLSDTATDFTPEHVFTKGIEGPATNSKGELYVVNFEKEGTIGKVDKKGNGSVFAVLPGKSVGNGIRFDRKDNMYIADYVNHNVLTITNGTNQAVVFAHESRANQPNDVAISPDGTLYASDPNWKDSTGNLWKVDRNGFHLLESNMGTTNGIEVSPDGKKLYVNESVQKRIWVYTIGQQGNVSGKKLFYSFKDFGLDGMRCDSKGNLYVCRYGAGKVVVLSPRGKKIREIRLKGKNPTNITFGGKNKKQCFVTISDRGAIETFFAKYPGKDF